MTARKHHESAASDSHVWLTPKPIIDALGGAPSFDLDPCAAPEPRPWATALRMNGKADGNGLLIPWEGRVWLNPPYDPGVIGKWMRRLADHGTGTALIFARTETQDFQRQVFERATGILFLEGRLRFHRPDGRRGDNPGAPSVLIAYGETDFGWLERSHLPGQLVRLTSGCARRVGKQQEEDAQCALL